jgi:hypothetical protein
MDNILFVSQVPPRNNFFAMGLSQYLSTKILLAEAETGGSTNKCTVEAFALLLLQAASSLEYNTSYCSTSTSCYDSTRYNWLILYAI